MEECIVYKGYICLHTVVSFSYMDLNEQGMAIKLFSSISDIYFAFIVFWTSYMA